MKKENRFQLMLMLVISMILFYSCFNKGQSKSNKSPISLDSSKNDVKKITDYQFLDKYSIKVVPHLDTTNFDNFKLRDSLSNEQIKLLQLDKIASGDIINFWLNYRLSLASDYKTLVVSYMPDENELYTILINYNKDNNIIDFDTVAYDEIAESCMRTESVIKNDSIEVIKINYCSEDSGKPMKKTLIYTIASNGEIKASH
jgi:hypothetical protein